MQPLKYPTIKDLVLKLKVGFIGRAGIILFGSLFGQGLAFVLLPLVTRIYDASVIGRAASTLAFLNIVSLISSFQFDQALIVSEQHEKAPLLILSLVLILLLIGTLEITILIIRLLHPVLLTTLQQFGVNQYLFGLIIFYSLFLLFSSLRLRDNQLVTLSSARVTYYGGSTIFQIIFGILFPPNENTFLLGQLLGAAISVFLLLPYGQIFRWILANYRDPLLIYRDVIRVAIKYRNFPTLQMPAQLLNSISHQFPILFMRWAFSDAWAGWYFIAWRSIAAPSSLLLQAVGQVFYRDSAEKARKGVEQGEFLERVIYGLIFISFLPIVGIGLTINYLINFLFGSGWEPVAVIIQILLISLSVSFFTSPISTYLNVKNKQAGALGFNALLCFVRIIAIFIGWLIGSEISSILLYSIATTVVMLVFFNYIIMSARANIMNIMRSSKALVFDGVAILLLGFFLGYLGYLHTLIGTFSILLLVIIGFAREIFRGNVYISKSVRQ
jgi:O-antigen/teichoic acid export membrane protein